MQHSPWYQSSPLGQPKKKDRTGAVIVGSMVVFMMMGFVAGLVLLAIRNSYLFS